LGRFLKTLLNTSIMAIVKRIEIRTGDSVSSRRIEILYFGVKIYETEVFIKPPTFFFERPLPIALQVPLREE
jgi:hypothetical protein